MSRTRVTEPVIMSGYILIPLCRRDGSVRAWAKVDDVDADLADERWRLWYRGGNRRACGFYAACGRQDGEMYLHRAVLQRKLGRVLIPRLEFTDHINGDGLDNRRDNLRVASKRQNNANRAKRPGFTSAYLGVCTTRGGRWLAEISDGGRQRYLGQFDTEAEAALAYNAAALEVHGEFARLNVVDGAV